MADGTNKIETFLYYALKSGDKIIFSNVSHTSEFPTRFHFVIISIIVV